VFHGVEIDECRWKSEGTRTDLELVELLVDGYDELLSFEKEMRAHASADGIGLIPRRLTKVIRHGGKETEQFLLSVDDHREFMSYNTP